MELVERKEDQVVVIELKGDVLGGPDANKLTARIREMITEGDVNIVLDLKDVEYMNSSGLGMLTSAQTSVKKENGEVKLSNPSERIESLLKITKLNTIFESYKSVGAALQSFS